MALVGRPGICGAIGKGGIGTDAGMTETGSRPDTPRPRRTGPPFCRAGRREPAGSAPRPGELTPRGHIAWHRFPRLPRRDDLLPDHHPVLRRRSLNNFFCRDRIKFNAAGEPEDPHWRGDFKGLIQRLDYIRDLGFTAIWITPPVENRSGLDYHGYHPYDWTRIDPRLESPTPPTRT